MFYTSTDRMFTQVSEGREGTRVPLHNVDENGERPHQPEEASSSGSDANNDGTWGERDIGGPVNFRNAMIEYEDLRRELTQLSKTRSAKTDKSHPNRQSGLRRTITGASTASRRSSTTNTATEPGPDLEAQGEEKPEEEEEFELGDFLKDGHFEKRKEGESAKKVGVVYKNLTVQGVGATTTFVKTLPSAIIGVRNLEFSTCS